MKKYTYGEYGWNKRFQKGMKLLRDNKTPSFQIRTGDCIHTFLKIGDFVERTSRYYRQVLGKMTQPPTAFYYYELKSGRRICPIHLERLVGKDQWSRFERKCPVEGCSYETEAYCFGGGVEVKYTQKFIDLVEKNV